MRFVIVFAMLFAMPAWAGSIYKCKGPNGEVTFTNTQCPDKESAQHYGTYQRAPDSPDQYYAAAEEAEAIRQRNALDAEARSIAAAEAKARRDSMVDAADFARGDKRSAAGRAGAAWRKYQEELADYEAVARKNRNGRRAHDDVAMDPPSQPAIPAHVTGCTQVGPSVKCRKSDGTMSYGNVNPYGQGTVSDGAGNVNRIQPDPFGKPKLDDGTCMRDVYGQCQ